MRAETLVNAQKVSKDLNRILKLSNECRFDGERRFRQIGVHLRSFLGERRGRATIFILKYTKLEGKSLE
jgi:hypothetical protein